MESFESLKSEIIEHLKKLADKEDAAELKKAIEYFGTTENMFSYLEKSLDGKWIEKAGYGVGTIRIWKGKKYKKVSTNPTRWVRVFDKNDRGAATSMGRYIAQVKKCESVEELYQFCMKQRSLFQDENGVDLPIMDKLRSAIGNQETHIKMGEQMKAYQKEDLAKLKDGNYSFDSFEDFKAEINKQAASPKGSKQSDYIGYLKQYNDKYLKEVYDAMNIKVTSDSSVKDWYKKEFPTDDLGDDLTNVSFQDIYDGIKRGTFKTADYANDSVVRERIFQKIAELKNIPYKAVYDQWLNAEQDPEEKKAKQKAIQNALNKQKESESNNDVNSPEFKKQFKESYQQALKDVKNLSDSNLRKELKHWEDAVEQHKDSPALASYMGKVQAFSEELADRVNAKEREKESEAENKTKKFDVDSIKGQEGPVTMFKNQMETWNKDKLTEYYNEKLDKIKNNKVSGATIQNVKNQFVAAKELLNEKFGNDNKESESKTKEEPAEKPKKETNDYSNIKIENVNNTTDEKIGIGKAIVSTYHYNDSHPDARMISIPATKQVIAAFKNLDEVVDHGKSFRFNALYTRHFGICNGFLCTTDGRQAKRVKVDGLEDVNDSKLYDAEIKDGNLVLKEQPSLGTFPNVTAVVPVKNDKSIILDNKTLKNVLNELKSAKYFKNKGHDKIDINFSGREIKIGNTVVGKIDNYDGNDLNMRVNYKYLLGALSNNPQSILNFNTKNLSISENGKSYVQYALSISENTGDNIFMPLQAGGDLPNPDEYLTEHKERGDKLKESVMSNFDKDLNNLETLKDIDKRLKTEVTKYIESLSSEKAYDAANTMVKVLPFIHKILNEEKFVSMELKPEFGKTEGSKYVRFRDKQGNATGSNMFDNKPTADFIKILAKNGAFGVMKKSSLNDYIKNQITILKKSLIF